MSLIASSSSPHTHYRQDTAHIMRWVIVATLPGLFTLTYFFGFGPLINIIIASFTAMLCEAAALYRRNRNIRIYLQDSSALVTAILLGLALPHYGPWWLTVIGTAFAILIAKHAYGGLGYNPFNPAMVGYVVLLISFPVEMTQWASPLSAPLGLIESFQTIVLGTPLNDAMTMATPLDQFKFREGEQVAGFWANQINAGTVSGIGWEHINLAFLLGGLVLLGKRIYTWHAPVAFLASLSLMALMFYDNGSSHSHGSPLFHIFSGASMLGAFFILTDPVSSAVSTRGRLIFGAGAGLLTFLIRAWGNYPDAVAFSVLLMNFAAPFIDQYTQPRTYGHKKGGQ